MGAKKLELALTLCEETLKISKEKLGPDHPLTLNFMNNLALFHSQNGKLDLAIPLAYFEAGKLDMAMPVSKETPKLQKAKLGPEHRSTLGSMATLGLLLLKMKNSAEAEPILRECLAGREKVMPDDFMTFNTQSQLGGALFGQQKFDEAEPLLLAGYEGMKQRQKSTTKNERTRLAEAAERLLQLYETLDKKEETAKWQEEIERLKQTASPSVEP